MRALFLLFFCSCITATVGTRAGMRTYTTSIETTYYNNSESLKAWLCVRTTNPDGSTSDTEVECDDITPFYETLIQETAPKLNMDTHEL